MQTCKTKLDREQAIFVVECILTAAVDQVEGCLPTGGLDYAYIERNRAVLEAYCNGSVESAGMAISIFYAQQTDDGMGVGDALTCCDNFDKKIDVLRCWAWDERNQEIIKQRQGNVVINKQRQITGSYLITDIYKEHWPNCNEIATKFVDEYLLPKDRCA